jgi:hypothetical protein
MNAVRKEVWAVDRNQFARDATESFRKTPPERRESGDQAFPSAVCSIAAFPSKSRTQYARRPGVEVLETTIDNLLKINAMPGWN